MEDSAYSLTPPQPQPAVSYKTIGLIAFIMIVAGSLAGLGLSKVIKRTPSQVAGAAATPQIVKTDTEVGSTDTTTFGDSASGTLEKGGLNGEGTHKLIRQGGPSQTVYLISSIVDLDEYFGRNVEVFGQTLKAQKAGWLMDVGRIKLVK